MKTLHWIIFSLAVYLFLAPFIADDLVELFFGMYLQEDFNVFLLLRWDDLFIGLTIAILALVVVTMEQTFTKTPGLKAMHWMQVVLGGWIAAAPFAMEFNSESYMWSHLVVGGFVAVFALLQIYNETYKKKR